MKVITTNTNNSIRGSGSFGRLGLGRINPPIPFERAERRLLNAGDRLAYNQSGDSLRAPYEINARTGTGEKRWKTRAHIDPGLTKLLAARRLPSDDALAVPNKIPTAAPGLAPVNNQPHDDETVGTKMRGTPLRWLRQVNKRDNHNSTASTHDCVDPCDRTKTIGAPDIGQTANSGHEMADSSHLDESRNTNNKRPRSDYGRDDFCLADDETGAENLVANNRHVLAKTQELQNLEIPLNTIRPNIEALIDADFDLRSTHSKNGNSARLVSQDTTIASKSSYRSLDECLNSSLSYTSMQARARGQLVKRQRSEEPLVPVVFLDLIIPSNKGQTKRRLKALLDSGASATIADEKAVRGLEPIGQSDTVWTCAAGQFHTSKIVKTALVFPEFSETRTVTSPIHTSKQALAGYDIIIGRDLLCELGIVLDFQNQNIIWGMGKSQ